MEFELNEEKERIKVTKNRKMNYKREYFVTETYASKYTQTCLLEHR